MRILRAGQDQAGRTAVTIGVYDGVHRGHRWLLRKLRHAGQSAGLQTALVTFDPHPLRVLRPVAAPRMLADLDQRLCLLSGTGCVDVCVVLDFDTDRSEQQAEDFVEDVLVGQVHAAEIVVGAGFRFGHDRAGDIDLLSRLGEKFAFSVTSIPLLPVGPESAARPCSSTLIRSLVSKGDVESAARLLCRPHEVSGTVAGTSWPRPGRGVPNVVVRVEPDRCVPLEGAYAGLVFGPDGRRRPGGISVRAAGPGRPGTLLDVHVLDRPRELMDQQVQMRFLRRIWTSSPAQLHEHVRLFEEDSARAEAAGGWAAAM